MCKSYRYRIDCIPLCVDLIAQLCKRLTTLSEEVKLCTQKPGESLGKAVSVLIDTTHKCINGMSLGLSFECVSGKCSHVHVLSSAYSMYK